MATKELIIRLIHQDLRHSQLILGLSGLGLCNPSDFSLEILDIVAELMGLPPDNIGDEWCNTYIYYLNQTADYEVQENGDNLKPLAEQCYENLLWSKDIQKADGS